jgi:predicted ArsR family transcriptional regulator
MIIGYETKIIEKHLTPQQEEVLRFLKSPATAAALAEYLGVEVDSTYPHLRLLQRLDLVEKAGRLPNPNGAGSIVMFKATGRPPKIDQSYMRVTDQVAAHNPFGMAQ